MPRAPRSAPVDDDLAAALADPDRSFHARVHAAVRLVPAGRVATYGDVGTVLGSPRFARQVGWALAALPEGTDVPWHRVINAAGAISHRGDIARASEQLRRLEEEGVEFAGDGTCALPRLRWDWPALRRSLAGDAD